MRWLSQVAHVAAKDARMTRWLAVGYAVLVALAAFQLGGGVLPAAWSALAMLIVLLAIAQVVQDDPAIRDDAFWVSRPLSPSAVFTAKALTLLVAAAIALAGQAVLLARYAVTGSDLLHWLVGEWLTWLGMVGAAVIVAALTRDLRGFVIALIAVIVAYVVVGALLEDSIAPLFTRPDWVPPLGILVGSLAIAGYQYVSGRRLRAAGLLVALLAATTVLGWAPAPRRERPSAPLPVLAVTLRPDSILVRAGAAGQDLAFRVVGGSPHVQYRLTEVSIPLRGSNDSVATVPLRHTTGPSAGPAALPELPGVRWMDVPRDDEWTGFDLEYQLERAFARERGPDLAAGRLVPVSVTGTVEGWQARVGARLPLRVGASVVRPGRRLRVHAVTRTDTGFQVELEISRLDPSGIGFFDAPGPVKFAIVDGSRGTAYPLTLRNTGGGNGGTFLLPEPAASFKHRLEWTRTPGGPLPPPSTDSLELLAFDWRPVGRFPVSLPVKPSTR